MIKQLRLSQSHLNYLENCPRQFQRIYLENLAPPEGSEQLDRQSWGSKFHLLMQQWSLGLPIEGLLNQDEQLKMSFEAIRESVPQLNPFNSKLWQEAEHCRTLNVDNYLLTVIYDLLIAYPNKAEILDWKTYPQPTHKENLANNWQTRLYLYVLAETSEYLPEQISLTYWFVKLPKKPEHLTINYTSQLHQKTDKDLRELQGNLKQWLDDYQAKGDSFPHREQCETSCYYYKMLAQDQAQTSKDDFAVSISEVEEVFI